jgi:hypothetical protein
VIRAGGMSCQGKLGSAKLKEGLVRWRAFRDRRSDFGDVERRCWLSKRDLLARPCTDRSIALSGVQQAFQGEGEPPKGS